MKAATTSKDWLAAIYYIFVFRLRWPLNSPTCEHTCEQESLADDK